MTVPPARRHGTTGARRARTTLTRITIGVAMVVGQIVVLPFASSAPVQAAASLSVLKTSSANGADVVAGDTVTYTIVVTNDSPTDTATDLVLDDLLPAGVSYVAGSTTRTYNVDGTTPGSYTSPNQPINVDNTGSTSHDTTGLVPVGATLTSYSLSVAGDAINGSYRSEIDLQATYPGGTAYNLDFGDDLGLPGSGGAYTVDQGPTAVAGSAEGVFSFNWSEDFDDSGVDNSVSNATFTIEYGAPSSTRTPTSDAIGTPPNLVTAGEGIDLLPGETMTVSFDVLVDDPLAGGITELTNTATASSDGGAVGPVVGSVTDPISLLMETTKSANPASGSVVQTGDTITYTVEVANNSTSGQSLTNLDVDDVLPDGVTFVSGTVDGVRALYDYRDDFTPDSASGSDGATDWSSTPWVKTGDDGTDETGGDTRINNDVLEVKADGDEIFFTREFDLSGCTGQTATLSFDWEKDGDLDDTVYVELFNPTTSGWEVQTSFLGGPDTTGTYSGAVGAQFFDAGAQIRVRTGDSDKIDMFYIDNVEISTDGLCAVVSPAPAVGAPPNLVDPADGFAIAAGETATITVVVTVDGTDQVLDNAATATTNEFGPSPSNTVSHTVEMLTVTKTASPPHGSNVLQGDTISYTIGVENTSGTTLTDFALTDVLPTGVSYDFGTAQISGVRNTRQYRDQFDNTAYDNSDGSTPWTATWDETNDDDNATGGNIRVVSDSDTNALRLDDGNGIVSRAIPLDGCVSATLSYNWRPGESVSTTQFVYFELYNPTDGWVTQQTYTDLSSTGTYTSHSQAVPASFLVSGAELRFRDGGNGRRMFFDNVDVSAVCDVVAPGTPVNAPPFLVASGWNYAIAPGETATVTFDVTVDPLPGGTSTLLLQNAATASVAEAADLTSNTVEHTVVSLPFFRGTVYFDQNLNSSYDAGSDPAIGETVYAKLIDGLGDVVDVVSVDLGTGAYEFQAVTGGTYSIIIDDNNGTADTTPNLPNDWDFFAPGSGTLTGVVSGGDGAADVENLDVGVRRDSDLAVTKVVQDATSAWNEGTVTYHLTVTNNGPDLATDIVINDVLPAGVSYDSHSGDGTYSSGSGDWTVASLTDGQTATLDIVADVTGAQGDVITNTATLTSQLGIDGTAANDSDSDDFTVLQRPPADVSLTKTVDDSTGYTTGSVTYTLVLTNDGPNPTGALVVDDPLPAGLTFVSALGSGSYSPGTGEWSFTNVLSGQTRQLDILATVNASAGTVITNTAEVASQWASDPDSTPGNGIIGEDDDDSVTFTVTSPPTADLSVTKSVDVTNAGPGDAVTYTVEVTNNGPDSLGAGGGFVTDILPASLGFQTYSTLPLGSGTYDPITGVWDFGVLAVGDTATLTLNTEVLDLGASLPTTVTNAAATGVNAPVVDDDSTNDNDSIGFDIPRADLSLEKKIDGADSIFAEILTAHQFTLTLTNAGPSVATDVVVNDLLPSGFVFQGSSATLGVYDQGLWTIPSMPVGTETLTIDVSIGLGGQLTNTAELVSAEVYDIDSTPDNGLLHEDDMDRVAVTVTNGGSVSPSLPGAVCYAIADSNNTLVRIDRDTGAQQAIGSGIGFDEVEATAIDPSTGRIYTVNGFTGQFGEIDVLTGLFSPIGPGLGTGSGYNDALSSLINRPLDDIDGMHFDPVSGALYASVRVGDGGSPADVLVEIDPATGTHVQNAFDRDGNPSTIEDFVRVEPVVSGGSTNWDIDGLAVDLDGTLYGIANTGGFGDQTLVRINKITGATTIVGVVYLDTTPEFPNNTGDDIQMTDLEGLSIDLQGQMYLVTGSNGATADGFHDVNKTPDNGRIIAFTDNNLTFGTDYESLTCAVPPTDIAVEKTVDNETPPVAGQVTYSITITNNGPVVASGIEIEDVIPAGLSYVSYTASQGTYTNGVGVWQAGGLLVLDQATLTITADVTAPSGTTIVNTATLDKLDQPDSDPTNDSDTASLTVGADPADIRGAVYNDADDNGFESPGDIPIQGVLIELYEDNDMNGVPDGPPIATTITLGDGTYLFEDVLEGTYLILETDPYNMVSVADADGANDNTISVTMPGGVDSNANNFLDANTTDAQNDINQTPVNVPVSGSVATNDTDAQGDNQAVTSALADTDGDGVADDNLPLGAATTVYGTDESGSVVVAGTLELNSDGTYEYIPATDFEGDVPAIYAVTDDNPTAPATDIATLTIDVFGDAPGVNDPPVAQDDTNSTLVGVPVGANVIDPNDTDPDGDALTVTSLLMDTDGDGQADDPVAVGSPAAVYGTDVNGNVVPAGTLVVGSDGAYTFTPNSTFIGDVPAEYTIEDPDGLSDDATLTITIEPNSGNDTFADDDHDSGPIDTTVNGDASRNDLDPQGHTQTVTSALADTDGDGNVDDPLPVGVATPVYSTVPGELAGTLTLNSDGTYTFVPETGFTGTVPSEYTVEDGHTKFPAAATALLTIDIYGPADAPLALDDAETTSQGEPVTFIPTLNDVDPDGDPLTVTQVFADTDGVLGAGDIVPVDTPTVVYGTDTTGAVVPAGTLLVDVAGQITFTPYDTFVGDVPAAYTASDGGTTPETDTAAITITVAAETGNATFANDDANSGPEDLIQTGNILDNDNDPEAEDQDVGMFDTDGDGIPDTVPVAGTPFNITQGGSVIGTLEIDPETGAYIWDPVPDYFGTAVVPYTATDGMVSDTATLYLTTLPVEAEIGDFVWLDVDNDGLQDAGEPGFEGATVWLLDEFGNVVDSTVTDATGAYQFTVTAGDYRITVTGVPSTFTTQDSGSDDDADSDVNASGSTGVFAVTAGDDIDNIDIGVSSIPLGDYVWRDYNENGIQDAGEPGIPGVTVNLYDENGVFITSMVTGVNGDYLFTGLTPGAEYTVEVISPDYGFTAADQGTDDRIDSDVDVNTGRVTVTPMSACPPEFTALNVIAADGPVMFPPIVYPWGGGSQTFGGSGATENYDASFVNGQAPYAPHPDWTGDVGVQFEHLAPANPDSNAYNSWFWDPAVRVTSVNDFNWNNIVGDGGEVYRVFGRGIFSHSVPTEARYTFDFSGLGLGYLPAGTHIAFTDVEGPASNEHMVISATGQAPLSPFLTLESTTVTAQPQHPMTFDALAGTYDFETNGLVSNGAVTYVTSQNLTSLVVYVEENGAASSSFKIFGPMDCDNTLSAADAGILPNTTDAQNDINQTPLNTSVSGSVATNDTDAQGDGQMVTSALVATGPDGVVDDALVIGAAPVTVYGTDESGAIVVAGTLALDADGSYDYVPALDFEGTVPAIYTVTDDNAGGVATDTATLTIDVMGNGSLTVLPPVAQDDTNSTEIGVPVSANVITPNDSDPEGQTLTVVGVLMDTEGDGLADDTVAVGTTTPVYGTDLAGNVVPAGDLVVNSDGTYTFTPNDTFVGDVPAEYTIEDTDLLTDDATLTITIEPDRGNSTFANDDANIGPEDLIQTGNIIDNDNDPETDDQDVGQIDTDGDGIVDTVPVAGSPVNITQGGSVIGTLEIDPETGAYIWDPVPGYIGTAVVPYTATDGMVSDTATLYLTTLPVNTTDAQNDENQTPVNVPVSGSVATNDTDKEDDAQTVSSALADTDGDGLVDEILLIGVEMTVYGTDESGAVVDAGTITLNADGSYDYVPALDFKGTVPAIYTVTDDNPTGSATDTATLTIEVFGDDPLTNNPPDAQNDTNTTEIGVPVSNNVITPNDTDPDPGDTLTVVDLLVDSDGDGLADDPATVGVSTPVYGTDVHGNDVPAGDLVLNADGTYTFTPNATFVGDVPAEYTISDDGTNTPGRIDDATLTITIVPDLGNSTFANDDANSGARDADQNGNIIANDNDPETDDQDVSILFIDTDGDGVVEQVSPVALTPIPVYQYDDDAMAEVLIGALTVDPETGDYNWNPEPDFVGTAVVPYRVVDDGTPTTTDDATLYLTTVAGFDFGDAPVSYGEAAAIVDDTVQLGSGISFETGSSFDDSDADDGADPADGTVTPTAFELVVPVTNGTNGSVWVCGWIDSDLDAGDRGSFDSGEEDCQEVAVGETEATLSWANLGGLTGMSWSRFRVATSLAAASNPNGPGGLGEIEDYDVDLSTLPVTVAYFSSKKAGRDIGVTWWSGTESGNAGYVVYGEGSDGELVAVTEMIVGAGDSFVPLEYNQTVAGGYKTLWLADVDVTGHETLHGPYKVGKKTGSVPDPVELEWETSQVEAAAAALEGDAARAAEQNEDIAISAAQVDAGVTQAFELPSGAVIATSITIGAGSAAAALSVEVDGLYRVGFEDLLAAGLDWSDVSISKIAVVDSADRPVPVFKKGSGKFGPGEYIEFWGESIDTLYSGTNVYRLVVDRSLRLKMDRDTSRVPKSNVAADVSYVETVVVEDQLYYSPMAPGDDPWHGTRMFSFGAPTETVFELDHVASGAASVSVKVWGVLDFAPIDDHDVSVAVNGVVVGDARFGGVSEQIITATVPDGVLVEGANTVTVTVNVVDGMPYDWVNLDEIAVSYPRAMVAVDGEAVAVASSDRVAVSGFTSSDVRVLRIDDAGVTRVRRTKSVLQSDGTYTVSFAGTGSEATYTVTQLDSVSTPGVAAARPTTGLLDGVADLLIISHSAFSSDLGDLIAAREAQGLAVKVVEVEDVYAGYTGEVVDPAAISAYIADAAVAFGDPAVLLVGADSYDYRDYTGSGSIAYIPTIYGDVGVGEIEWSPIDPAFVDLDGDQVPDLPLGRFPVRTHAELADAIDKAINYTPDSDAVFAAEDGFAATADAIAASLPAGYDVTTAYLDDLSVGDARTALLGGIDDGAGMTVFFGHSSTDQWTSQGLLTTADVAGMSNAADPTIAVQFGCWNTYFSDPFQQSLGSALLTSPAGAAAVLGATTLTSSFHDAMFGPEVMEAMTTSATIGDALTTAKQGLSSVTSAPDITMGWTLLGDPTTPLN